MLVAMDQEWAVEIDRGPDWLFIRLRPPPVDAGEFPLAETIGEKLEQSFCHRVVLEFDEVTLLRSWLIGQLVRLHKRLGSNGGTMRIAGLSPQNQEVLRTCRLAEQFPAYRNRTDAVMGHRPPQPR